MNHNSSDNLIDLSRSARRPLAKALLRLFKWPMDMLLKTGKLNRLYDQHIRDSHVDDAFGNCLKAFGASYYTEDASTHHVPRTGPLMVVSNHPFGGVDGIMLMDLLLSQRSDVKILANHMLHAIPEIQDKVIPVDVFSSKNKMSNGRALKKAIDWVKGGGALIVFPAGAVAHFQWKKIKIAEAQWNAHVAKMIRMTQAAVLPIHVVGRNSMVYQSIGSFSAVLRSLMLGREMVNKKNKKMRIIVGKSIPWKKLEGFEDNSLLINYLKDTVSFMRQRDRKKMFILPKFKEKKLKMEDVIAALDPEMLALEIEALPPSCHMIQRQDLSVYVAEAKQMPHVMKEIGRLRELSYRDVEEGSGLSCDVDLFDYYYLHLFVWNHVTSEVVGAYRLGLVDKILKMKGKKGLYTHTLFKYKAPFIDHVSDSIELGRSFIRPEYQQAFGVLPLLWRGICLYMVRHPQYRKLFGGVSISNGYKKRSKNLMVQFLKTHNSDPYLSHFVNARTPYRFKKKHRSIKHMVKKSARNMDDVSLAISSVEKDSKGIPVLVKHYLKLKANFLSFNVDKEFANVVDGLILVDMDHSSERLIRHYMGTEGYDSFMSTEAVAC